MIIIYGHVIQNNASSIFFASSFINVNLLQEACVCVD